MLLTYVHTFNLHLLIFIPGDSGQTKTTVINVSIMINKIFKRKRFVTEHTNRLVNGLVRAAHEI